MTDETRDIAVEAKTNITAHLADCASFRGRIDKALEGIFKRLDQQDNQLARQTWVIGIITGGWLAVSWLVDHAPVILKALGHK